MEYEIIEGNLALLFDLSPADDTVVISEVPLLEDLQINDDAANDCISVDNQGRLILALASTGPMIFGVCPVVGNTNN